MEGRSGMSRRAFRLKRPRLEDAVRWEGHNAVLDSPRYPSQVASYVSRGTVNQSRFRYVKPQGMCFWITRYVCPRTEFCSGKMETQQ